MTMMSSSIASRFPVRRPHAQTLLLESVAMAWMAGKALAAFPFDALRLSYASAVKAGLVEKSMLASRDFERAVDALERRTLGPLARRV